EQRYRGKRRIWTTNWQTEANRDRYGVSYTENGGTSWHNLLHDIKAYDFAFKDSIIYIATDEGVYRTDDDGRSWNRASVIVDPMSRQRFTTQAVFAVSVQGTTIWIASNDGIASTVDDNTHLFGQTWQVLRTYQPVGSGSKTYAYPNPFSPDDEVVRFHYTTEGKNSNVKIQIFDFGMNLVRTLLRQAPRTGNVEHDEIWDGRDDQGTQVANGVYFYKVETVSDSPAWGKVIVLQ
ncbi:MAG: FlgD immunoglobulin-like domain containing protein, partial [Bacteroidota bacterium]